MSLYRSKSPLLWWRSTGRANWETPQDGCLTEAREKIQRWFPSQSFPEYRTDTPGTLEAYYQEAGRGGRDGKPAECILLFDEEDVGLQRWFIKRSLISKKEMLRVYVVVERAPGYQRFRWIEQREIEWHSGCDQTKIRVVLSYLQRLGFIRQHPNISRELHISRPKQSGRPTGTPALPSLTSRLDTLSYCARRQISPLTLMERLYDARWQGHVQFHGSEKRQLIECLRPTQELQHVTAEQLGMKDFERQKQHQLDQMILYAITTTCRQNAFAVTQPNMLAGGCCC